MGFGILLLGYFLSFAFALVDTYFYADIIGGLIMLYSFNKLARYNDKFKFSVYATMAFCATSMIKAVLLTFDIVVAAKPISIAMTVINSVVILFFHMYMLSAISDTALDANEARISNRARSNRIFIALYYALYIVTSILSPFLDKEFSAYVNLTSFVFGVVYVFLNSFLIYSCFSTFVVIGEEVKEPKPSKIGFVNKMRMRSYEARKKIAEENYQMAQKALEEKKEEKRYKPKKKKKKK